MSNSQQSSVSLQHELNVEMKSDSLQHDKPSVERSQAENTSEFFKFDAAEQIKHIQSSRFLSQRVVL